MAEVHMARDIRLGRTVAVKMLRVDLARDPTFQARFRREAQSAASLNHPSVVAVYDTGEDIINGLSLPYIVMEYVDGSTLRELIQTGRRLLPERALEITAGVLQALEYSHRNGIIHRDIKPGNVMLTRSGAVKVMDFGIARAMADTSATMTQTAAVIGTAQYLSPEQARGESVDARSDLYSTGCLLYELLTGRPPFVGDSPVAVAYQHVREDPVPPSHVDPEVSPGIDRIVLTALAKNPENRYQSADEMRTDIERAIEGRPVAAPPVMPATDATQRIAPISAAATSMYDPVQLDDEPPQNRKAGYALLALAVVAIFLGALFLGRTLFAGTQDESKSVSVPSLLGITQEAAEQKLKGLGLVLGQVTSEPNEDTPEGQVVDQNPDPEASAKAGDEVDIVLSAGPAETPTPTPSETPTPTPEEVEVPDLRNLSQADAVRRLQQVGLKSEARERNDDEPPGTVVETDPAGGEKVKPGSTVTLFISRGPDNQVEVPDVTGDSGDDAENELRQAGLRVRRLEAPRPGQDADPGDVWQQNPQGGTRVDRNTQVTIVVQPQEGNGGNNGGGNGGGNGNGSPALIPRFRL
jgi:serine/threonine-protein kinase